MVHRKHYCWQTSLSSCCKKTDKDVISKTVDINNVENLQLVIQNKNAFEGKVNDETVVIIPFGEDFIELEIVDKENRATQINMSYITSIDNRRADRITLTAEKSGKIPVKKVIAAIKHKKDEPIIIRVSFSDKMGSLIDVQYPVYPAVKGIAVMTSKDSMREIDKLDKESGIDPLSKTQAIDPAELKKIEDRITSDTGEFDTEVLDKISDLRKNFPDTIISVDGGVNFENAQDIVEAGVNRLVSGSAIYESDNIREAITELTNLN